MARVTQEELRDREAGIIEEHRAIHGTVNSQVVYDLIVTDRLERWAKIVKALKVPTKLQKWAGMMAAAHGPQVIMHRGGGLAGYPVDWITALMIVRYGEAEYFWPEKLSDEDLARAYAWLNGKRVPPAATFIPKEG